MIADAAREFAPIVIAWGCAAAAAFVALPAVAGAEPINVTEPLPNCTGYGGTEGNEFTGEGYFNSELAPYCIYQPTANGTARLSEALSASRSWPHLSATSLPIAAKRPEPQSPA